MELSDTAKEMLDDLRLADPWAMTENVIERVKARFAEVSDHVHEEGTPCPRGGTNHPIASARCTISDKPIGINSPSHDTCEAAGTHRTPEDVINILSAELNGLLIVLQDMLDTNIDDLLECLKWQYEALQEGRNVRPQVASNDGRFDGKKPEGLVEHDGGTLVIINSIYTEPYQPQHLKED